MGVALLLVAGTFLGLRYYQKRMGVPCSSGDECNSNLCLVLPNREEGFCSRRCDKDLDCPDDWACRPVAADDDDKVCLLVDKSVQEPQSGPS